MKQIEIKEKRKEREKHFLQENGEIIAEVYDEDIHYLKNGKYEEINNSLIKNKTHYYNRSNNFKTYFGNSKSDLLKVKSQNHKIAINLKHCNVVEPVRIKTKSKLYSSMIYKNILNNIDLQYKVMPTQLKEEIILNDISCCNQDIIFLINTNLELQENEDKSIKIIKNNKIIFTIKAPFMYDANLTVNNNLSYKLDKKGDLYELKLILDKEWLKNSKRKYPITIDPTITNHGQNNSVYDTYIYPGDTNVTRHDTDILKVGVEKVNGVDRVNRTLLKFNLPTIGTGSQIVEAELNLIGYPYTSFNYLKKIITIHQITEDWEENTANWNNMNNKYNSRIENCFTATRSTINYTNNTLEASVNNCYITNLVKKWYSDTPNYGIMLKLNEEVYTDNELPSFYSKNNNVIGDNPKPVLIIRYRNQNGLENYMEYYNQEFDRGIVYENLYNGNLTGVFTIGSTFGGQLPALLNLIYNTNDVVLGNDIGYGLGYRLNIHQTIKDVKIDNTDYLEYIDQDGTTHYFKEQNEKFYDEDGLNLNITKNTNDYIMTDKEGNLSTFIKTNGIGYLTEYKDTSQNKITISYDINNRITKITDANNQEINLIYENNKITIISPDETITLNYTNNQLINITSITGTTIFSYDNNLISNITDENNKKFDYEYYAQTPYRIHKITEYGTENEEGNYLELIYSFNTTKIKDRKNNIQLVTFNSYGNPVSTINLKEENSITGSYGKIEKYNNTQIAEYSYINNKLLSDDIPEKHVKNYLSNTGFEDEVIKFTSDNVMISFAEDTSYSGNKSLKLFSTDNNQEVIQVINVPKGNYYTFSTYIKNTNNIKLALEYKDEENETIITTSDLITENETFTREDVTIYYPETATDNLIIKLILLTPGVTYLDNVQLEEGEIANNYNYIENSDFSNGIEGWNLICYEGNPNNILTNDGKFEIINIENNVKALKVNMNPAYTTVIKKQFKLNGKAGEIFNISFWYKNKGVKGKAFPFENNYVCLYFDYGNNNPNGHQAWTMQLNSDCDEWQYCSAAFISEDDYNAVRLELTQYFNANEFYITNLNIYKDLKTISYNYDENGNIISVNGLNKESNDFNYDSNNQLIKMTDPIGNNFIFEYDNIVTDRIIKGISGVGINNEYIYDQNSNPITCKINNYKQNNDISNNLYRIRIKGTYKYLKNINNNIKISEDYCGHNKWYIEKQENFYRIKHSIITDKYISIQNDKVVLSTNQDDTSLFTFSKNDNGSYLIKAKQSDKYLKYNDILELVTLEENNPNFEFYFEEDSYKDFIESSAEYTEDGRFINKIINTNLNETTYDIDSDTGLTKSYTNSNHITTNYIYNDKNQIIKVKCKDQEASYSYNDKNLLEKITQGNTSYNFIYDNFLNIKQIKVGDNITLITHNYENNNGNLISSTYGNNNIINFTYDDFDRITTITKMNDTYNYKYGNNGDLLKIISQNSIIKYIYDSAKRVHEYRHNNFKIKYNYNKNDNIESKTYKLNDTSISLYNEYNADDIIIKKTFDNNEINYNYDLLGRISSKNINNIFNINYDYIRNGNRSSLLIKSINNNNDIYSYNYDKLDNITHIYHNNKLINKYHYDDYDELIEENDYQNYKTIRYKYDNSGNILSKKVYNLHDNSLLAENKYEYNNSNWGVQLTTFNNELITYDQIGNPLTIGDKTLTWINGRELNSYNDGLNNITYKYNSDGIRTSKITNNIETKYYLEGNIIVCEQTGNNIIYYIRDEEGNLEGFKYNGNIYHYIKNIQNDIIGIIDNNYNKIVSYEYDSWGNTISITDSNNNQIIDKTHIAYINPFRYRSYYYDKETNLYYLNSRYYNPVWGRFLNADGYVSTGQGILGCNMYIYAKNNFINGIESNGRFFKKIIETFKVINKKYKSIVKKIKSAVKNIEINFAAEYGVGYGWGISAGPIINTGKLFSNNKLTKGKSIKKIGVAASDYGDYNRGYKNGKFYEGIEKVSTVTIGAITNTQIEGRRWGYNDKGQVVHESPYAASGIGVSAGDMFVATADDSSIFIGIEAEVHIAVGGHIRIGWEIDY